MFAILYESNASRPNSLEDLYEILGVAVPRNRAEGVTGMLLYGAMAKLPEIPGQFVQWLEGPEERVMATYERIRWDSRHTNVRVIARGPLENLTGANARLFPDWAMTSERLAEIPATLYGFLDHVRRRPLTP